MITPLVDADAPEWPMTPESVEPLPEPLPEPEPPEIALQAAYRASLEAYHDQLAIADHARQRVAALEAEFGAVQADLAQLNAKRQRVMDESELMMVNGELGQARSHASDMELLLTNWKRSLVQQEARAAAALETCQRCRKKLLDWRVDAHLEAIRPHILELMPLLLSTAKDHQAQALAGFFGVSLPSSQQVREHLQGWFGQMNLPWKI